jgi:hypothetical protein
VEYQDRDAAVATFLENQLNDAIAQDLASSNADLVPLDFTNHDMCATGDANDTHSSSNPWVFAPHFESFAGPKCQYPSMTGAEETNPIFSTNCVAHPTIIGQQKIADTITNALSRGLQHPRGSQPPDISATTTTSTSPHHGMLGSTLLTVGGFQYRLQVVRANEDPNGVQNTNTLSQPSVPPATPGTTYLRAVIRVHNLQADRAAPLPDLSEFPVSLGAPIGVFPPPTNSLLNYCWSESQDVLAAFYPGDDPTECSETTVAAVLDSGSVLGSTGIKPSSNADVTIYFSVPQNLPLRDFRIVASPSLALTAAEYASGVPLG